jgi:allantoicase
MLSPEPAVFIPGKYDDHGKWMDGWETGRRRSGGFDFCIVRLGLPGIIEVVDIDTSHFTGNFPPAASIDACSSTTDPMVAGTQWTNLVPPTSLKGNSHHLIAVQSPENWTHIRINIYPDGGVARLRVYGRVVPDWSKADRTKLIDLLAVENGGRAISCNDRHYGTPMNLIKPGRGVDMGDGWETRRRREPGSDWAILVLGHQGRISKTVIDTAHFKGNYPDRCSIQAAFVEQATDESLTAQSMFWPLLLPEQKLEMDREHVFSQELVDLGPVSHVRLNIIPDGGVSRLRLFGRLA